MRNLSRDTLHWTSEYGETELVKDMSDEHVQNIVHYLEGTSWYPDRGEILALFLEELKIRGLKPVKEQIPHKDDRGRWRVWDFERRRNVLIENRKDA